MPYCDLVITWAARFCNLYSLSILVLFPSCHFVEQLKWGNTNELYIVNRVSCGTNCLALFNNEILLEIFFALFIVVFIPLQLISRQWLPPGLSSIKYISVTKNIRFKVRITPAKATGSGWRISRWRAWRLAPQFRKAYREIAISRHEKNKTETEPKPRTDCRNTV